MSDAITHFDALYRANPDPWDYQSSTYEARKYAATLAALTQPHYRTIIEPGCSIGVLSAGLAARCDRLVALDFSPVAVRQAKRRLAGFAGSTANIAKLPQDWPEGRYDLIMFSELIYYLAAPEIIVLAHLVARDATAQAECVIIHYQGDTETDVKPDEAQDLFCKTLAETRSFAITDHLQSTDYSHRTLIFLPAAHF